MKDYVSGCFYSRSKTVIIGLLCLIFIVSPAQAFSSYHEIKTDTGRCYSYFLQSMYLLSRGNIKEAQRYLRRAIALNPRSSYLALNMAKIYLREKKVKEAERWVKKALRLNPNYIDAKVMLARIYAIENRITKAVNLLKKVLIKKPHNKDALILIATIYANSNEYAKAINTLKELSKIINGKSILIDYYIGLYSIETKQYKQAETYLKKVLSKNKNMIPAYLALARLYIKENRFNKAITIYKKVININPLNMESRLNLIKLYIIQNKLSDALNELKKLDSIIPHKDPHILWKIVFISLKLKKYNQALKALNNLQVIDPTDKKVLFYKGLIFQELKQYNKAIKLYKQIPLKNNFFGIQARARLAFIFVDQGHIDKAIKLLNDTLRHKKNVLLYQILSELYKHKKELKKAQWALEQAIKLQPKNKKLIYDLIILKDEMGQKEQALKLAQKLLKIDPNNPDLLNYIGYTYTEMGIHLDIAEKYIKKALEIKPRAGYIMDSLGWLYYKQGKYKSAIMWLKKAMLYSPADNIIAEHLAKAYEADGQLHAAYKIFKNAYLLSKDQKDKNRIKKEMEALKAQLLK